MFVTINGENVTILFDDIRIQLLFYPRFFSILFDDKLGAQGNIQTITSYYNVLGNVFVTIKNVVVTILFDDIR